MTDKRPRVRRCSARHRRPGGGPHRLAVPVLPQQASPAGRAGPAPPGPARRGGRSRSPAEPQTLPGYLDPVIDAVLAYCASTPSLPPLLTGTIASSDVTQVSSELHAALAQRIEYLLASKPVSTEQRRLAATVSVRILTAVLPDAVAGGRVNPAVAAELKTALASYLGAATNTQRP